MEDLKHKEGKPINRFHLYHPEAPYSEPKLVGMINNDNDYDLGTPSMRRQENITILASSITYQDSLLIDFKWRPCEMSHLVCLMTKIQLSIGENYYEHEEVITYKPNESQVRPGRIIQYGSQQSSLKLFIDAPYRRLRVTFRGHAKNMSSPEQGTKFIRANFIVRSTSGIFDYRDELSYISVKRPENGSNNLQIGVQLDGPTKEQFKLANDRHEQLVQIKGEYFIDTTETEAKVRGTFLGWGFHIRQFVHQFDLPVQIRSKRILILLAIGRAFHFGRLTLGDCPSEFATACLDHDNSLELFTKPYTIEWSQVGRNRNFAFQMSSSGELSKARASRKRTGDFHDIEVSDQRGWAWIEENEEFNSLEETQKWQTSLEEYKAAMGAGKFVENLKYNSLERPLVVSIADSICASSDLVGSKASSLAQLHSFSTSINYVTESRYRVPRAFVLTRFVYDTIIEENENISLAIQTLETLIGEGQLDGLKSECKRLQRLVSEAQLPVRVQQELITKLKTHYKLTGEILEEASFAVRSSSWGEDEEGMSAAGQLSTILGVKGLEAIERAIMSCFASKFTNANVEYKRQHGLGQNMPMAVIVQELIECDKAGVLFTCDPTTGNDRLLMITANYGLGESVVSGQAEPDSIRVKIEHVPGDKREVTVLDVSIGQKQIVINGKAQDGTTRRYDCSKCCLTKEEIMNLAECGLTLSDYYQGPRDIEWGIKGDSLCLFQSRPITSLDNYSEFELMHEADLCSRRELDFFARANIGEVKPFAITPLSISYADKFWCLMGFQVPTGKRYTPEANRSLFIDSYHGFMSMIDGFFQKHNGENEKSVTTKTMEYAIFGHEIIDPEMDKIFKSLDKREQIAMDVIMSMTKEFQNAPEKIIAEHCKVIERARIDVENCKYATDYQSNKLLGLLRQVEKVVDYGKTAVRNHGITIMFGNELNSQLIGILSKYISDPVKVFAALAKILASNPGVLSAEIPQRIKTMAKLIISRNSTPEVDEFIQMSSSEALRFIKSCSDGPLKDEFEAFIEVFGHRCYNEFEISSKPWRERPQEIAEMIQRNCANIVSSAENTNNCRETGNNKDQSDRIELVNEEVDNPINQIINSLQVNTSDEDRFLLKSKYIPKCQQYVGLREQTKNVFVSHNDLMRRAVRILAKELRRELRIPDEDLIYYLFYDELEPLVREPQPALVVQATRRRNLFRSHFRETWKYEEIIRGYDMTPIHEKLSVALDETLAKASKWHGTPASSGRVRGKVCLITCYDQLHKVRSGIITQVGGLISHGAVVAREYGLPSVLGVPEITRILKDGDDIILDADNGVIIRL